MFLSEQGFRQRMIGRELRLNPSPPQEILKKCPIDFLRKRGIVPVPALKKMSGGGGGTVSLEAVLTITGDSGHDRGPGVLSAREVARSLREGYRRIVRVVMTTR